jgi:hypothetical protein
MIKNGEAGRLGNVHYPAGAADHENRKFGAV